MSRRNGLVVMSVSGARLATGVNKKGFLSEMQYTPSYLRASDNKKISAKLSMPMLLNLYGVEDPVALRCVVWGGRACMFAKNLGQGKGMDVVLSPKSYWANQYYSDGAIINDRDGSPKTVRLMNFTIVDFAWGEDSFATVYEEMHGVGIATSYNGQPGIEGHRPVNWQVAGHADHTAWLAHVQNRKNFHYMGGDRYGFAKVIFPKAGGTILLGDQSRSAERVAGGEQNLINSTIQAGHVITVQPGTQPAATPAPAQRGTAVVAPGAVPIAPIAAPAETVVHNALNPAGATPIVPVTVPVVPVTPVTTPATAGFGAVNPAIVVPPVPVAPPAAAPLAGAV